MRFLQDRFVFSIDFDESQALLAKGWIENATTIIALQWLAANRARLRATALVPNACAE